VFLELFKARKYLALVVYIIFTQNFIIYIFVKKNHFLAKNDIVLLNDLFK